MLLNSIIKNPFKGRYTKDILIYDHQRKVNVDGEMVDIYTKDFINSLEKNSFEVLEAPYLLEHFSSDSQLNRKYRDHEILKVFLTRTISPLKLSLNEKTKINWLENKFNEHFKIYSINFSAIVTKNMNKFIQEYNYHKKLLEKRQTKTVYVVVSYRKMSLIAAAKDLGIEVKEFQHGVITVYHFAYNFGSPEKFIKYFPNKLLTFGEYWGKTQKIPRDVDIEVFGFPYFNRQIEKYGNSEKIKNQVLFISQGTIGEELSEQAFQVAKALPNYTFLYKLHPGEYNRWKEEYPSLIKASYLENFQVIDNNNKNLYHYFAKSNFQIGVNSTAIFEGLALSCNTIISNLSGAEYMEDLINQNFVMLAENEKDIINNITNFEAENFNKKYFFL